MADEIEHSGPVAFDAICALPGFCRLLKRSATLDGSLPLRAAQHCSPVLEGNAAGFQIALEARMTLRRTLPGRAEVELLPETRDLLKHAPAALEQLIQAGVLAREGYWDRVLRLGEFPIAGNRLLLWSGFSGPTAKRSVAAGSRAFNRACVLPVVEHLVADTSGFAPLLIEVDLRLLPAKQSWLEGEIASVLPVSPRVSMKLGRVTPHSGIVENFGRFYDAKYFAEKAQGATGKYRKQLRDRDTGDPSDTCAAETFFLGPDIHEVQMLSRFCTPAGFRKRGPAGEPGLPIGVIRNAGRIRGDWNGRAFADLHGDFDRARLSFRRAWRRAGGPRSDASAFLERYFFDPANDEPRWLLQPWVFAKTAPGWSTVMDGCQLPGSTGMRGMIRSDIFHPLAMIFHLNAPQKFSLRPGAPCCAFIRCRGVATRSAGDGGAVKRREGAAGAQRRGCDSPVGFFCSERCSNRPEASVTEGSLRRSSPHEAAQSIEAQVEAVLAWLKRHSNKETQVGMARFAIPSDNALGVTVANMRVLAKQLGRNHPLALALWKTQVYEARMLTAFVAEPARVTPAQMDRWCRDFDSWAICDALCMHLFDQTPYAFAKVEQWSDKRAEFEKRAAFALLASLAGHDKITGDEPFLSCLPLVERAATDERNFVKKGVNWALRGIGRRNRTLNVAAVKVARLLAESPQPSTRWVGKDALRELTNPKVLSRIRD